MTSPPLILVTGATGFVGKRLCRHLEARGHAVVGASRNPAAARAQWPRGDWRLLDIETGAGLVAGSVTDEGLMVCRAAS